MRAQDARHVPIQAYLDSEGVKPQRVRKDGRELWYVSPIRASEATASFKVDTIKNLWYDHGAGKGGNVIDLVCEVKCVTVAEALAVLAGLGGHHGAQPPAASRTLKATSVDSVFEVLAEREITHPALIDYLASRGIDLELGRAWLREIHFKPRSGGGPYFGLGFRCGDGWDVRSAVFKGYVGTRKDVSFLDRGPGSSVVVFEGFMDYLSFLAHLHLDDYHGSVLILHSTAHVDRGLALLVGRHIASGLFLYLDHDSAGRRATQAFLDQFRGTALDKSDLYDGHPDFNAWWSSRRRQSDEP
jgi:hypothetical protein